MADEATQTDATNSDPATQTDASGATASSSSTTDQTAADAAAAGDGDKGGEADPLDGASNLGDAQTGDKPKDGEGDGGEGDKPKEGEEGAGEKTGDEEPALTGAPEGDYDLTDHLPEGTKLDADALAKIAPTAKALNLSNAGLAKIAAEGLPIVTKQVTDAVIGEVVAQRTAWDKDTRAAISGGQNAAGEAITADPIYGGKSYDDVLATSAKALDRFGGADFRDFLKSTGLGNHPAMVKFAYQAGALISEDTDFERGGGIPNTPKSREEKYYGSN